MTENKIKITPAKGRPMLHWVGKKPLDFIKSFPAQLVEVFDAREKAQQIEKLDFDKLKDNWQNLLFHGDNKEVLGFLLANGFRGKVDLVYIDPPFDSNADYIRKVELRGSKDKARIEGEDYTLGEQIQYTDIWANDNYLQFMYERLMLLKELLSEKGFLFFHCDYHQGHYLKILMDEVFGRDNFRNEIVVKRVQKNFIEGETIRSMNNAYDVIFLYGKSTNSKFLPPRAKVNGNGKKEENWHSFDAPNWSGNRPNLSYDLFGIKPPAGRVWIWAKGRAEEAIKQGILRKNAKTGKPEYLVTAIEENWHAFDAPNWTGKRPNLVYELFGQMPPTGRCWVWTKDKALESIKNGELRKNPNTGKPEYLVKNGKGELANNLWVDVLAYQFSEDYPTEKSENLLSRVIQICSKPDDIVLDCFIGSGTTAAVAQKLGRHWIGCDINKGAIQTTSKRLQSIISEQFKEDKENGKQKNLNGDKGASKCYSFAHYKVNDYDLQLLRTEAIELAIEHIGIQRIKTDSFFEGILGKNLVKMIEFNHPLTLLDLQLIQDELGKRPDENRNVTVVCLGKELAVEPWIEDYNKKHPLNKLEVIELRTDKKYGKFLTHKPSEAKIDINRKENKAVIEIKDFISPSIIERLNDGDKLVKIKITDFRSMIDVVLIDGNYNGKVFNITHSDVPEKKNDLVTGRYEIDVLKGKTTVAVKIIDMLGEETLVTKEV